MQRSSERILTTHVGSLARPRDLLEQMREKEHSRPYDAEGYPKLVQRAVADVVAEQVRAGIDVVTDGEMGKVSFLTYVKDRLAGFAADSGEKLMPPSWQVEIDAFPEYYAGYLGKYSEQVSPMTTMVCTGPVTYVGQDQLAADIANLRAALVGHDVTEAFLPSTSPSGFGRNEHLATGDVLTHHRLRELGHPLGQHGGVEQVHALLELDPRSAAFAHDAVVSGYGRNPLYAVVHESSYADGGVTGWSAQRTMPDGYATDPLLLTGEHVFPWMFEEYGALRPYRAVAHELAEVDWPRLYDADVLARNDVPTAAVIYTDDLYVERAFSEETAAQVRGLRTWITSEYEHNALRVDGARVLDRLLELARDRR